MDSPASGIRGRSFSQQNDSNSSPAPALKSRTMHGCMLDDETNRLLISMFSEHTTVPTCAKFDIFAPLASSKSMILDLRALAATKIGIECRPPASALQFTYAPAPTGHPPFPSSLDGKRRAEDYHPEDTSPKTYLD